MITGAMQKIYLISCLFLLVVVSCKKKEPTIIVEEVKKQVMMVGEAQLSGEATSIVWTKSGKKSSFLLGRPERVFIEGTHLIQQGSAAPQLSFIGWVESSKGQATRAYMFVNGERKELSTLAGLVLSSSFSERIIECQKDDKGNTYVNCVNDYLYKIDLNGKVTHQNIKYGRLIFDNDGLKSVRVANIIHNQLSVFIHKTNGTAEEFKFPITSIYECAEGATYISAKKMYFFVTLIHKITGKEILNLLTVDIETKQFNVQEIGDMGTIFDISNSTIVDGLLYVSGKVYVDGSAFYLAIDVSNSSGPLKITRVNLERTLYKRLSVNQIMVLDKKVYVSGQYENQTALWGDGKLMEVNNDYFYQSSPSVLTSY